MFFTCCFPILPPKFCSLVCVFVGKVVECRPSSLQKRRVHRLTAALDSFRNNLHRKDMVKVIDGPHSGFSGEIRHLYRNYAFLHSVEYMSNGNIFVCKTKHLQLAGGNKTAPTADITMGMEFMSPRRSSPLHPSGGKFFKTVFSYLHCKLQGWFNWLHLFIDI